MSQRFNDLVAMKRSMFEGVIVRLSNLTLVDWSKTQTHDLSLTENLYFA